MHLGIKQKPPVMHGIAKGKIQRKVKGAGTALVHSKDHKSFGWALFAGKIQFKLELCHPRPRTSHIPGRRIRKKVLPCGIIAFLLCNLCCSNKCAPGKIVHFWCAYAVCMAHDKG